MGKHDQAHLNRAFLHRACVQISSDLNSATIEHEQQQAAPFFEAYSATNPNELVRALVWRVMSSAPGADRLGSWTLLTSVLQLGKKNNVVSSALTDKIAVFIPHLIRARWIGAQRLEESGPTIVSSDAGKASGYTVVKVSDSDSTVVSEKQLAESYNNLYQFWRKYFVKHISEEIRKAVEEVERGENRISAKVFQILEVPKDFDDSLWKLRRKTPRPTSAHEVWRYYCEKTNLKIPTTDGDIEQCAPMHPRVREWMRKLVQHRGGDVVTDMWKWTSASSPCSKEHLSAIKLVSKEQAVSTLEAYGFKPRTTPIEELTITVLDAVTKAMTRDEPFEELLNMLDSLRGRLSGSKERRALFIHASYSILPSHTGLKMTSAEDLPVALQRASAHFDAWHRHREKKQLLDCATVLFDSYRIREVQVGHKRALDDIKRSRSFLFCLLDPQCTWASVNDSPCADAIEKVNEILPRISRSRDLHLLREGEKPESPDDELWDYYIASEILAKHGLLGSRFDEADQREARERLAMLTGSEKSQFRVAVQLVLKNHVPFCPKLKAYGPNIKEKSARETLKHERISLVELRLRPNMIEQKIARYRSEDPKSERARDLEDALRVLGGSKLYPAAFATAIDALTSAHVPLAAARFAQDAVERAFRNCDRFYMIHHIDVVCRKSFPAVCLFTSSLHHTTEEYVTSHRGTDLSEVDAAHVSAFLESLSRAGISLEEFCTGRSPRALKMKLSLEDDRARGHVSNVLSGWDVVERTLASYRRDLQNFVSARTASQDPSQGGNKLKIAEIIENQPVVFSNVSNASPITIADPPKPTDIANDNDATIPPAPEAQPDADLNSLVSQLKTINPNASLSEVLINGASPTADDDVNDVVEDGIRKRLRSDAYTQEEAELLLQELDAESTDERVVEVRARAARLLAQEATGAEVTEEPNANGDAAVEDDEALPAKQKRFE